MVAHENAWTRLRVRRARNHVEIGEVALAAVAVRRGGEDGRRAAELRAGGQVVADGEAGVPVLDVHRELLHAAGVRRELDLEGKVQHEHCDERREGGPI